MLFLKLPFVWWYNNNEHGEVGNPMIVVSVIPVCNPLAARYTALKLVAKGVSMVYMYTRGCMVAIEFDEIIMSYHWTKIPSLPKFCYIITEL